MSDFKNKHLNNLWTNIVPYLGGTCTTSEIAELVKLFRECDDELSESVTFAHIKDLQDENARLKESIDIWSSSNDVLLSANMEAISKNRKLEKDLDDAKKQLSRARHAEEELRTVAKVWDNMRVELEAKVKRMDEITKERDSYRDLYTELSKAYDELTTRRLPRSWECTLEGTINVEINRDLLNKVCGINSED